MTHNYFTALDQQQMISGMKINFSVVSNLVASIGNFTHNGQEYYVKMPRPEAALSTSVLLSNLRWTVLALANPRTNIAIRTNFYQSSSLPGAVWEGQPVEMEEDEPARAAIPRRRPRVQRPVAGDFPLLMNPNDFIPEGYDNEDLLLNNSKNFQSLTTVHRSISLLIRRVLPRH